MAKYNLEPAAVPAVKTRHRIIKTKLPVPESLEIFNKLKQFEPQSMMGQPPVIWDHAEGIYIFDRWGNKWLDWSSCVLVANAGHGRREIRKALKEEIDRGLLGTYVFVHEKRAALCEILTNLSPQPENYSTFLLSTGSEATENAIKLSRTYGHKKYGRKKNIIITFEHAFHGRTLGAQMAGGLPGLKEWIVNIDPDFAVIPFPDGYRNTKISFSAFLEQIRERNINPEQICAVMSESYQGVGPHFFPDDYAREMGKFCRQHDILIIMDEVQSGFGRTGKWFCYEHYDLTPDLICCGKGITSSLPLSAVIGRKDIMDLYAPGSMTSTHSASPLPVSAALANIKILKEEKLAENAARLGIILKEKLEGICKKHPDTLGHVFSRGLVAGIQAVKSGTKDPNPELALNINEKCFQKGLLMFAPVGIQSSCIKIAPPLIINEDALLEGISVLDEACTEILG
ncbi:MAG: 4-aminobutyrate aminotransferase [Spirochaetes bacterium GWF1_41_5]|nr:MAG: 4-aminobutyrate aminotransferase [Spirochaetes bacterium GWF1_41_5]